MANYCVRADIEAIYGTKNVEKWADLDNEGVAVDITARITAAAARGTSDVNSRLKCAQYPLPFDDGGATVPEPVEYLCSLYAGFWLYQNRGVMDYDGEGNAQDQLQHQRKEYDKIIRMVIAGTYFLTTDIATTVKGYPHVVTDAK